eukprot:3949522-Pleurochrysis_carterae.AAC.1
MHARPAAAAPAVEQSASEMAAAAARAAAAAAAGALAYACARRCIWAGHRVCGHARVRDGCSRADML